MYRYDTCFHSISGCPWAPPAGQLHPGLAKLKLQTSVRNSVGNSQNRWKNDDCWNLVIWIYLNFGMLKLILEFGDFQHANEYMCLSCFQVSATTLRIYETDHHVTNDRWSPICRWRKRAKLPSLHTAGPYAWPSWLGTTISGACREYLCLMYI